MASTPERRFSLIHISGDSHATVSAWLAHLAPLATPGAAIQIGHFHSGRPGARQATQEFRRGHDARLYAGPLPQVYFYAGASDGAGTDAVDWSRVRADEAYHDYLNWIKAQVAECYASTAPRDRNIVAALAKMALPQRADLYMGHMIGVMYGDTAPAREYPVGGAGTAAPESPSG